MMKPLTVARSAYTPSITFDKEQGKFEIEGRSLPEDALEFYAPAVRWLAEYLNDPNPETRLAFKFEYINTMSVKVIQQMLAQVEGVRGMKVLWYYHPDDEDIEELGRQFAEIQKVEFEFPTY